MPAMWARGFSRGGVACAAALFAVGCLLTPVKADAATLLTTLGFQQISEPPVTPDVANQLFLEIWHVDDGVNERLDFIFQNRDLVPSVQSAITNAYLGDTFGHFVDIDVAVVTHSGGSNWVWEVVDPDKPQHGSVDPHHPGAGLNHNTVVWEFRAGSANDGHDGIIPGEELTISFLLHEPFDADDFLAGFGSGAANPPDANSLFVALGVQGIDPNDQSAQFLSGSPVDPHGNGDTGVVIPVPPAFGLGLMGFAMVGMNYIRRRKVAA